MAGLKLRKLPNRAPIRLMIALSPEQHQALVDYAGLYREAYGEEASPAELVPFMLDAFLASDRNFMKSRRRRA